jgi:hypothetical protein
MTDPVYSINKLDPAKPSSDIGVVPKSGMIVYNGDINNLDTLLPAFFMFRVGGGGDLYMRGFDGSVIPYLGLVDGQTMLGAGNMIYSSVTISGNVYSTSCTDICIYGGQ